MSVRGLETLRTDQDTLMAQYRAERGAANPEAGTGGAVAEAVATILAVGKVTAVVESDPDYGAYLVVQIQEFAGAPPQASDASIAEVRAYPTPNRVVTDYSVDEFVNVQTVRGALLAAKLG